MDAEAQLGGLWWNRVREEERRRKWGRRVSRHTDELWPLKGFACPPRTLGVTGGF